MGSGSFWVWPAVVRGEEGGLRARGGCCTGPAVAAGDDAAGGLVLLAVMLGRIGVRVKPSTHVAVAAAARRRSRVRGAMMVLVSACVRVRDEAGKNEEDCWWV
jgi:hypothetical protein